jgi:hypothetical protein
MHRGRCGEATGGLRISLVAQALASPASLGALPPAPALASRPASIEAPPAPPALPELLAAPAPPALPELLAAPEPPALEVLVPLEAAAPPIPASLGAWGWLGGGNRSMVAIPWPHAEPSAVALIRTSAGTIPLDVVRARFGLTRRSLSRKAAAKRGYVDGAEGVGAAMLRAGHGRPAQTPPRARDARSMSSW